MYGGVSSFVRMPIGKGVKYMFANWDVAIFSFRVLLKAYGILSASKRLTYMSKDNSWNVLCVDWVIIVFLFYYFMFIRWYYFISLCVLLFCTGYMCIVYCSSRPEMTHRSVMIFLEWCLTITHSIIHWILIHVLNIMLALIMTVSKSGPRSAFYFIHIYHNGTRVIDIMMLSTQYINHWVHI